MLVFQSEDLLKEKLKNSDFAFQFVVQMKNEIKARDAEILKLNTEYVNLEANTLDLNWLEDQIRFVEQFNKDPFIKE